MHLGSPQQGRVLRAVYEFGFGVQDICCARKGVGMGGCVYVHLLSSEGGRHGGLGPEGGHKCALLLSLLLLVLLQALRRLRSFLIAVLPEAHLPSLGLHILQQSRVQGSGSRVVKARGGSSARRLTKKPRRWQD